VYLLFFDAVADQAEDVDLDGGIGIPVANVLMPRWKPDYLRYC
jgi:hypothetical protein